MTTQAESKRFKEWCKAQRIKEAMKIQPKKKYKITVAFVGGDKNWYQAYRDRKYVAYGKTMQELKEKVEAKGYRL